MLMVACSTSGMWSYRLTGHSYGSLFTQWNVELLIRRTVKWQLAHPAECGVTDELAINVTFLQHRNANNSSSVCFQSPTLHGTMCIKWAWYIALQWPDYHVLGLEEEALQQN